MPDNFFSPLASVNREHYAALLVLYYRLFQENTRGLERELVVREFMNYLALHRDSLKEEDEEPVRDQASNTLYDNPSFHAEAGAQELDFGVAAGNLSENRSVHENRSADERTIASKFLRRFINAGWLSEETLADFTKVINITAYGKPFMKSLADIDGGLKTEYESHVVTVYSMLCGETIKKDGHHAVLKAHEECRSLIDSLKVLSQSIKGYYDSLNVEAVRSLASSALHEHYDLYMGEVLDRAYKRLKTSDNVSRYRQGIFKQVAALLKDDKWLDESAGKYTRILQTSRDECRKKLTSMLEEIRDDLKSVDPLEDEIDRRNAAYSRSSTEIIKAYIEPDSTIAGKIGQLIKAIYGGNEEVKSNIIHGLHRIRFLSPSSLVFTKKRAEGDFITAPSKADVEALAQSEAEFLERMKKRLSIKRINAWLDEQGGKEKILIPEELITGEDSYIRFIYALLYGDSRNNFSYNIEDTDKEKTNTGSVKAANYIVPDIRFRKKIDNRATVDGDEL
ncbi:Wadjet anti-phage system protein JetA family protein [Treponema sp. R80B11-R83G3]